VAVVNVLKGSNGVGIRMTADGRDGDIVWPSRLAVHLDPPDPTEPCWRCQALRDAGENQDDPRVAAPFRGDTPSDPAGDEPSLIAPTPAATGADLTMPSSGKPRQRPGRAPAPKKAREAWVEWRTERSSASAADFCASVSSWIEGTAAQLLRARWPSSDHRPSAEAVQARLCHHLGLDPSAAEPDHLKALAIARRDVLEELRHRREGRDGWIEEEPRVGAADSP
jgi:hypothetical protein